MPIVFIIQMECTLRRTGNAVFSEGAFLCAVAGARDGCKPKNIAGERRTK